MTTCLSISTALLESLLIAGNFYGWPSLQYVLTKEGYFAQQCFQPHQPLPATAPNSTAQGGNSTLSTCTAAKDSFNLVFQLSLVCLNVFTIAIGYILDRWGTWVARSIGCGLLLSGYSLLCVMTTASSWVLYPAMATVSTGGFLLVVTNTQLGNLIPNHRSLYITMLNGLFDSGTVIFLLFKLAYQSGLKPIAFYSLMVGFAALCAIRTFLLMPRYTVTNSNVNRNPTRVSRCEEMKKTTTETQNLDIASVENESSKEHVTNQCQESNELVNEKFTPDKIPTFKSCLFSKLYLGHVTFYSACYVRYVFVLGSVIAWLGSFRNDEGVSFYTEVLGYMLSGGAIVAPLNGLTADRVMKFYRDRNLNPKAAIMRGLLVQVSLTALLQILLSSVILTRSLYLSFVLLAVFRAFLFGTAFNFIAQAFPAEHFGKLMGVTQALVGVASLFQYALFRISASSEIGFTLVNSYLLVVSVLCLGQPLLLYRKAFSQEISKT